MFDRLSDGFNSVFRKLSGQGTISEKNIADAMDDVRTALLEADVHFDVVGDFVEGDRRDRQGFGRAVRGVDDGVFRDGVPNAGE